MNLKRLCSLLLLCGICTVTVYGISVAAGDREAGEQEEAVSLDDLPRAVMATMLAEIIDEVDDLELEEIEREKEDGKTVYEAEFQYKGKDIELEIAANGKLLVKKVEYEDDDEEDEDK